MPRRLIEMARKRDWQEARLTGRDLLILAVWIDTAALVRGVDYYLGETRGAPFLIAFPTLVWGLLFAAPAVTLGISLWRRNHFGVWAGHFFLSLAYLMLAAVYLQEAVNQPHWDGLKTAFLFGTPALIHFLLHMRTGPRPSAVEVPTDHVVIVGRPDDGE